MFLYTLQSSKERDKDREHLYVSGLTSLHSLPTIEEIIDEKMEFMGFEEVDFSPEQKRMAIVKKERLEKILGVALSTEKISQQVALASSVGEEMTIPSQTTPKRMRSLLGLIEEKEKVKLIEREKRKARNRRKAETGHSEKDEEEEEEEEENYGQEGGGTTAITAEASEEEEDGGGERGSGREVAGASSIESKASDEDEQNTAGSFSTKLKMLQKRHKLQRILGTQLTSETMLNQYPSSIGTESHQALMSSITTDKRRRWTFVDKRNDPVLSEPPAGKDSEEGREGETSSGGGGGDKKFSFLHRRGTVDYGTGKEKKGSSQHSSQEKLSAIPRKFSVSEGTNLSASVSNTSNLPTANTKAFRSFRAWRNSYGGEVEPRGVEDLIKEEKKQKRESMSLMERFSERMNAIKRTSPDMPISDSIHHANENPTLGERERPEKEEERGGGGREEDVIVATPEIRRIALAKKGKLEKILGSQLQSEDVKRQLKSITAVFDVHNQELQNKDLHGGGGGDVVIPSASSGRSKEGESLKHKDDLSRTTRADGLTTCDDTSNNNNNIIHSVSSNNNDNIKVVKNRAYRMSVKKWKSEREKDTADKEEQQQQQQQNNPEMERKRYLMEKKGKLEKIFGTTLTSEILINQVQALEQSHDKLDGKKLEEMLQSIKAEKESIRMGLMQLLTVNTSGGGTISSSSGGGGDQTQNGDSLASSSSSLLPPSPHHTEDSILMLKRFEALLRQLEDVETIVRSSTSPLLQQQHADGPVASSPSSHHHQSSAKVWGNEKKKKTKDT